MTRSTQPSHAIVAIPCQPPEVNGCLRQVRHEGVLRKRLATRCVLRTSPPSLPLTPINASAFRPGKRHTQHSVSLHLFPPTTPRNTHRTLERIDGAGTDLTLGEAHRPPMNHPSTAPETRFNRTRPNHHQSPHLQRLPHPQKTPYPSAVKRAVVASSASGQSSSSEDHASSLSWDGQGSP